MSILDTRLYTAVKRSLIRSPIWNDVRATLRWYYENNARIPAGYRMNFASSDLDAAGTWRRVAEGREFWGYVHHSTEDIHALRATGATLQQIDAARSRLAFPTNVRVLSNAEREAWLITTQAEITRVQEQEMLRRRMMRLSAEQQEAERLKKYTAIYD